MAANFQILRISGNSDLPFCNSRHEVILGSHVLWERTERSNAQPRIALSSNIFAHDFTSPIASTASLDVTIKASDHFAQTEVQYRLSGYIEEFKVFEGDYFAVPSQDETNVPVKVVIPATSNRPFAWTGDVNWLLEHPEESTGFIRHAIDTHLELYWISKDIHEIFLGEFPGIPISLLRVVIPNLAVSGLGILVAPAQGIVDTHIPANLTFSQLCKKYDTTEGRSRFRVNGSGGTFNYRLYIAPTWSGQAGSLQPIVNCYDQAAMTQVVESFGHLAADRLSWLYMNPFGFILPTNLVGIPGICNNPFFMSNGSPQHIGGNNQQRTAFGNHAFNGMLPVWNPGQDRIFDGCGGPHTGDDPQVYVNTSIDRTTTLYNLYEDFLPGTVTDIVQYNGVTNPNIALVLHVPDAPDAPDAPGVADVADAPGIAEAGTITTASNGVETLILSSASPQPEANILLQNHWDDVPTWINTVAGANTSIAFHSTDFGNRGSRVHELWHLSGVAHGIDGDDLVLQVTVHTSVSSNGTLDLQRASAAALDNLRYELKNTDMYLGPDDELLNTLWEPSPVGQEYSQYAMQLSPNVPRGHIMIVSGNTVIDLYGGSSSASLEPLVRKLLSHTTISRPISLSIPKETSHQFDIPTPWRGSKENAVKGVGTSFTIVCQLPHPVSVSSAIAKDGGVLLKTHTIKGNAEESAITFEFITFKIGIHDVNLFFATTHMLTGGKESIQVIVEEAN